MCVLCVWMRECMLCTSSNRKRKCRERQRRNRCFWSWSFCLSLTHLQSRQFFHEISFGQFLFLNFSLKLIVVVISVSVCVHHFSFRNNKNKKKKSHTLSYISRIRVHQSSLLFLPSDSLVFVFVFRRSYPLFFSYFCSASAYFCSW